MRWFAVIVAWLGLSMSSAQALPQGLEQTPCALPLARQAGHVPAAAPCIIPRVAPLAQSTPHAAAPAATAAAEAEAEAARVELARATTREAKRLRAAERQRAQATADKARQAASYEQQLRELDRLKRQRPSWRRDRQIRDQLRASHQTAEALAAAERRVRKLDASLEAQRRRLVRAIERELAAAPPSERLRTLASWRAHAERHLQRARKKIVLPDDSIDPLADPEELEHQAALLRQAEAELARELSQLDQQAARYGHMAQLGDKRARADELGRLDSNQPRRVSVRGSASSTEGPEDTPPAVPPPSDGSDAPTPAPPSPPDEGEPSAPQPGESLQGADVVLADVVDALTLDALRAAARSPSPAVKAKAAERASSQVRGKLETLRAQRQRLQQRARELRQR
ncbi:hypothetical protein [Haliangium ochraceum]|uniref:Uncharacterized protein n=1 Tax=Haliangium ochraceum (strain DSM 14365 / JCM 11303 / SMP-2) TaxID=502025 RepID=D0LRR1_HALO1|nr:hypothetical protein [Haliangium ochraceum]ACY19053.1 hypothetical protein Hoch_6587 [Haliangium ochraceum DSM 14365]